MSRIYTSRFSNKELKSGKYYRVGITLGRPKFRLGYVESEHCYMLAPDRSMWGKSREEFRTLYREKLDAIGEYKIKNLLREIGNKAEGRDVVLLCYEDVRDPSQHCHRTTLAEWLGEKFGLKIEELDDPSPVKFKKAKASETKKKIEDDSKSEQGFKQMSLFDFV